MDLSDQFVRYIRDGAATGETGRANREALDRVRLVPRVLELVADIDPTVVLFGTHIGMPLVIAPMASQRIVHPEGELAVARAAAASGVPMVLALSSTTPVEEVAAVPGLTLWFQIYPFADPGATHRVIDRAVAAGSEIIVVAVDMPPLDQRSTPGHDLQLPAGVSYAHHGTSPAMSSTFQWRDLEELIQHTTVPVVVKGVLHPSDAKHAWALGARAVVVSNHGGRVQDGLVAAIDALERITVEGSVTNAGYRDRDMVFVDGAIESGVDIGRGLAPFSAL